MGRWGLGRGLRLRDRRCRPTPGRGVSCEERKIWGGGLEGGRGTVIRRGPDSDAFWQ